jgi:hypothetical protein
MILHQEKNHQYDFVKYKTLIDWKHNKEKCFQHNY